jgi:hypothetical protein
MAGVSTEADGLCVRLAQRIDLATEHYLQVGLWVDIRDRTTASSFLVCLLSKLLCCDESFLAWARISSSPATLRDAVAAVIAQSNLRMATKRSSIETEAGQGRQPANEAATPLLQLIVFVSTMFDFDAQFEPLRSVFLQWSALRNSARTNPREREIIVKLLSTPKDLAWLSRTCLSGPNLEIHHMAFARLSLECGNVASIDRLIKHLLDAFEDSDLADDTATNTRQMLAWLHTAQSLVLQSLFISPQALADLRTPLRTLVTHPNPVGCVAAHVAEDLHSELNAPGHFFRIEYSSTPVIHLLFEKGHETKLVDALLASIGEGSGSFFLGPEASGLPTDILRCLIVRAFRVSPCEYSPVSECCGGWGGAQ